MSLKTLFKNLFKNNETGFKVVGDKWFAQYSNCFEDREGEYFPRKAIDAYIARVDHGIVPLPKLWIWHEPIVIGEAKELGRIEDFACAWGTFAESKAGQIMKEYLSKHKSKLSHGFEFDPEAFKDNAYHNFNTFEISVLPFNKGVEANAYTSFEVKDMSMTDEKKQRFIEWFGEERANELIAETEEKSKALREVGVAFKSFPDVEALKMDKPDGKKPMDDDEDDDDKMDDEKSFVALYAETIKDIAELAEGQNIVAKALQRIDADNKSIKAMMESERTAQKTILDTLKAENERLRKELDLTPARASESSQTATDPESDANKDLKKNIQDKEANQGDPFWLGAKVEG